MSEKLSNLKFPDEERIRYLINKFNSKPSVSPKEEKVEPIENPIILPSSNENYWEIPNVNYLGKTENYHLSKILLPKMTQDEAVAHRLIAEPKKEFYTADLPLQFAIFEATYNLPNIKEKEEIRISLKKEIRKWSGSLTRIQYNSSGKDKIIHNYKIPNKEYFKEVNLIGPDKKIGFSDEEILEALLLTKDFQKVNEILNWINETNFNKIWRIDSKPRILEERVLGFGAGDDRAGLGCSGGPSYRYSNLGVRTKAQGGSP